MLIAWAKGKRRSDVDGYEDEIVSAVFGPLRYFERRSRAIAFNAIINDAFRDIRTTNYLQEHASECNFSLWPNLADNGRIEPDITVEMYKGTDLTLVLIIEAKWNSSLHLGQLRDQWLAAKKRYPNCEILHIFLAKKALTYEEMEAADEDHRSSLASMTWSQLASTLVDISDNNFLATWAEDVRDFFCSLTQAPFMGVGHPVKIHSLDSAMWTSPWTFHPGLLNLATLESYAQWNARVASSGWRFIQ